jgi:hypothetical protein
MHRVDIGVGESRHDLETRGYGLEFPALVYLLKELSYAIVVVPFDQQVAW